MAASVDMWELAGTGGTPRYTVESETYGPNPGLLAVRVGSRCGCGKDWSRQYRAA